MARFTSTFWEEFIIEIYMQSSNHKIYIACKWLFEDKTLTSITKHRLVSLAN